MRKIPVIKIVAISLLALVLIPLMGSTARANGSQTWYLTDTAAGIHADDGAAHVCDDIMHKVELPCQANSYQIRGTDIAWWYSENSAEFDVTFDEDNWYAELYLGVWGSGNLQAQVWSIDESGHMERLLAEGVEHITSFFPHKVTIECGDYEPTEQTVLEDHRLALRLDFEPDGINDLLLLFTCSECCGASRLHSPETDPGFPIPELPAIVLLAGGLGCIGGYMVFRRWRSGADSTDGQHSQG